MNLGASVGEIECRFERSDVAADYENGSSTLASGAARGLARFCLSPGH
jgi:hypothetical protein